MEILRKIFDSDNQITHAIILTDSLIATKSKTLNGKLPLFHLHLFLNREGRWGTTDDFTTSFLLFFSVLHSLLGLGELQACEFYDVVFLPLFLSALSSSPFDCALEDGFGQT